MPLNHERATQEESEEINRPPMKSIILIGYMCAGKTTVGRAVAKKLGCTFYELDW